MAWIIQPLQIADEGGNPTGKWRMTAKSDEDGGGPFGCLDCSHDTPEEAKACEKCDIAVSLASGFPSLHDAQTEIMRLQRSKTTALDELHRAICIIGIVTDRDGHDLIRRDSVLDIIDQRRFKR